MSDAVRNEPPARAAAVADNTDVFTPQDWALFMAVSVTWGSSFLLIAIALEDLTPGMITLGRVGLGALTLWAIRLIRGTQRRIDAADRGRVVALSFLWVAVPFTLFPLAQEHINSAVTGLLNGATPVLVAVVSTIFLKVAPRGAQLAGIVVGFVGIALVSLASAGNGSSELTGVLMVLGATVCYGIAINLALPLQQKYGAIVTMSSVLGLATIWVLPVGFVNVGDNDWSFGPIVAMVVLGAINTGAAYWIMATLVGRVGGIRASFITYMIPVVSLVLGVALRDDEVAPLAIVGTALVLGGAFLASRRQSDA